MKFRVFMQICEDGVVSKTAINVDTIAAVWVDVNGRTCLGAKEGGGVIQVAEDFDTVVSRLNTIAE